MNQIAEAYGVLKLSLHVDYSKNQAEVYREATEWVIGESDCLGILSLLSPERYFSQLDEVSPSWMPDYSCSPPRPLRLFTRQKPAGIVRGKSKGRPVPDLQGDALCVQAKLCGTLADIGDTSESMFNDGCFEMTARVLLNCPLTMSDGTSRLDTYGLRHIFIAQL